MSGIGTPDFGAVIANRGASYLEVPRSINDYDLIENYAEGVARQARSYRIDIERNAVRSILMYLGLHWIQFDNRLQTYRPRGLKKSVPRPVTNKYASIVNHICSALQTFRPPVTISPATREANDLSAALAADQIQQIIEKETDLRRLKPLIAKWLTLNGSVFLINNYDMSPLSGWTFIQMDRCLECQRLVHPDEVEEHEHPEGPFEAATEPNGEPIGVEVPRGKHYTEVKSILDCYVDYEVPFIEMSPHFMVSELQSKAFLERIYGKDALMGVEDTDHGDVHSQYVQALAYSTGSTTRVLNVGGHRVLPRVRVRRLWIHPTDTLPDGLYAVVAGTRVLESMPWRYHKQTGEPFLNVTHIKFDDTPGRLLGKSRTDDLTHKQEQRNRVESIIELHSRRMANAVWLVADGAGLSRLSGEEGQIVRYNAMAGVPPPQRMTGDSVPPYLVHWIAQIDAEMDEIAGTYEVGRGEAPRGVSAYAALQLLDERARQGQAAVMENWAMGFLSWTRQHLDIWREYADEERYAATGIGKWGVKVFSQSDLEGGIDLNIEIGENTPRTSIGRRANIEQAVRVQAINIADPMERFQLLEALGIPELMEDHKTDLRRSNQENDAWVDFNEVAATVQQDPQMSQMMNMGAIEAGQMPAPPEPPMPWDNHMIHVMIHRRFLYSDAFQELLPQVQQLFMQHMLMHMGMLQPTPGPGGQGTAGSEKPGGKGTAKEGGGGRGAEQKELDRETQGASPDTGGDVPR